MTSKEARAFLDAIKEDSPEQCDLLWFENASGELRRVAFIQINQTLWQLHNEIMALRERKQDAADVEEREAMLAIYRDALAGIADLPLGKAALERAAA